jgi:hypothetical protein
VTSDTLRKFNRDTRWLATGVLGLVATAAFTLASLDQRPLPKEDNLAQPMRQPEGDRDLFVNASPRPRPPQTVSNGETFHAQMSSGWAGRADYAFVAGPLKGISSSQTPVVALNSPPIVAFPPEIIRLNAQANAASASQASTPPVRPKTRLAKRALFGVRRVIDVKARLIALWHQSLKREQKVRSWTTFSNLSGGAKKKAAYTAETNH